MVVPKSNGWVLFAGHVMVRSRTLILNCALENSAPLRACHGLQMIIGVVAGFIAAEAASAFLAATATGVGQIAAVLIQLARSAFGAIGMVEAGIDALKARGAVVDARVDGEGQGRATRGRGYVKEIDESHRAATGSTSRTSAPCAPPPR